MRIIAGQFRGRKLKGPLSLQTRPTSDRLRETLFNILAPRIEGARFLDLCAGSGAVGIEALSRGAAHVTFVDQSRRMCELIETNLGPLNIDKNAIEILLHEAFGFLRSSAKKKTDVFDIIFFDPPYAAEYEATLNYLGEYAGSLLTACGLVIVEHHKENELKEGFRGLHRYRIVRQGDSILSFYRAT